MRSKQEVEEVFRRLLNGGVIRRLPKSRKDTNVFLALAAASFDPRGVFSEAEVNDHLIGWMSEFTTPATMDHVTMRRYLVDFSLLLRDESCSRYTASSRRCPPQRLHSVDSQSCALIQRRVPVKPKAVWERPTERNYLARPICMQRPSVLQCSIF